MKKEIKKKWNPPVISSTLPIKRTLGKNGSMGNDGGVMLGMRFTS